MQIRCPHCSDAIDTDSIDGEETITDLSDVHCPACGSSFNLISGVDTQDHVPTHEHIGHFRLEKRVGAGASGAVWRAHDEELDRTVAIKIPKNNSQNPRDLEMFVREARAVAQLQHPGIVSMFEVGRDGETLYLVSEFIDGLTLADWMTGQRLTPREAAALAAKLAEALHYAHEAGVVHRDLKPANILLDRDEQPHIADFGLARREVGEVTLTVDGQILGTPAYMAPEQARGDSHSADRRADVYAIGGILFELLTGERPFRGNSQMLLHQVLTEPAPRVTSLNSHVPRDLETICLKCLEKEPGQRYQTAGELLEDLQAFLERRPVKARPIGKFGTLARWSRRKPMIASLSAAVILLTIGGVSGIVWQWQKARANFAQSQTYLGDANRNLGQARAAQKNAEEAKVLALASQKKTEEAKKQADEQRSAAEESFSLARQTLYRFLTQVPNHELLREPGLEPVKRDLQILGRDYYLRLVEARPDDLQVKFELALARFFLAMTLEDLGENKEAAAEYLAASVLMQEQFDADPDRPRNQRNLAACLGNLANLQVTLGERSAGIASYRKILVMQRKLVDQNPDDSTSELHMAMTMLNLGSLEYDDQQFEAAVTTIEETLVIGDQLLAAHADDPNVQEFAGEAAFLLGRCLSALKKPEPSLDSYQRAATIFQELVDRQPDDLRTHEKLSGAMSDVATLHFDKGDRAAAEAAWETSLKHGRVAHTKAPQVAIFRQHLAWRFSGRAYHRAAWGEWNLALVDLTESRELLAENAFHSYATAQGLVDFVSAIDSGDEPVPAGVATWRGDAVTKAFVWLNEAIDLGFYDVRLVESVESWARLKDLPEYKAALRKMTAARVKSEQTEPEKPAGPRPDSTQQ
ncbi:MAG: protein kinase [Planctomycetota bacterium]|nr:protein kinase [Planctomycetota bacterium]